MNRKTKIPVFFSILLLVGFFVGNVQSQESVEYFRNDKLLYQNSMASENDVANWKMEGPGVTEFKGGMMEMYSPDEEFYHVFWCPQDFHGSFIAEWELQNLETDARFCIIFFSVKGDNGESIFDSSFPERYGTFSQYSKSKYFNNYHISYAVGDASNAYSASDLKSKYLGLNRFRRYYLMLRPSTIVIYDELEAEHPAEWTWLLHHDTGLEIDVENKTIEAKNDGETASFTSTGPIYFEMEKFNGEVTGSSKLIEKINGESVFQEVIDEVPDAVKKAMKRDSTIRNQ